MDERMTARISIHDEAPDFDLSSTEGALLMLRDEIPRTAVLLYLFIDPDSARVRKDLASLGEQRRSLADSGVKILGMSPTKMPALKALQVELQLPFPLLCDDRDFSAAYGLEAPEEGEEATSGLYLVNMRQEVDWLANPLSSVDEVIGEIRSLLKNQTSPTTNYPKSVINRLVDRFAPDRS